MGSVTRTRELTFSVDTSVSILVSWLVNHLERRIYDQNYLGDEQHWFVHQMSNPRFRHVPHPQTYDEIGVLTNWNDDRKIAFGVQALAESRSEVIAECHGSDLEGLFEDVLFEIAERWPESGLSEQSPEVDPAADPSFKRKSKATRERECKTAKARRLRAEHPELTQAEIANKVGRTERTIRKYLK